MRRIRITVSRLAWEMAKRTGVNISATCRRAILRFLRSGAPCVHQKLNAADKVQLSVYLPDDAYERLRRLGGPRAVSFWCDLALKKAAGHVIKAKRETVACEEELLRIALGVAEFREQREISVDELFDLPEEARAPKKTDTRSKWSHESS